MFKSIKHSILSEIDILWKTNFIEFKIKRTLMSYEIILNKELKIFIDLLDAQLKQDERICFSKTIYSIRNSDKKSVKNKIEFYLDEDDFKLIDIEDIENVFHVLVENENLLEHLYFEQQDFQSKNSDKTSFLELVVEFIEDKKHQI